MILTVDPTDLQPGDVVVSLNDHDLAGCHCDVVVTIDRPEPPAPCCADFDKVITDTGVVRETHSLGCPALSDALIIRRAPE